MVNPTVIDRYISLPAPFLVNMPYPIDSRSYFSDLEEARAAVSDAVYLERVGDKLVLPSEEEGGRDTLYYFGQPVFVVSKDGDLVDLYLVVRKTDEHGETYGDLESVCKDVPSDVVISENVNQFIEDYINKNLNTDCIDGYLFTDVEDGCGRRVPSNGLYAYGFQEIGGLIKLCEEAKKVLSFDPQTVYDSESNPLATVDSVRNRIRDFNSMFEEALSRIECMLQNKVDKIPGYGLSQNDFTDCLKDKLMNMPDISISGNKLTINGKSYKLTEWEEMFDYYIGWLFLKKRETFMELSKDELMDAVKATGTVPPEGKLYGPDTACGYNTFFVMKKKNISINSPFRGEYSEWNSNGLPSPIRTYIPSVMQHSDVMINDFMYDVYGLHTYRPNSSDFVQIAFNTTLFDYYVGWMKILSREDFYTKTTDDLIAHAEFGSFDGEYYVYENEYLGYNLFYVMVKSGVGFDEPVEVGGGEDYSRFMSFVEVEGTEYGLESPLKSTIASVMEHDTVYIGGVRYRVYGVHSYRINPTDKVHIVFSK